MWHPAATAIFAASTLVAIPPEANVRRRAARHSLDFWRYARHLGNEPRIRRPYGIRGVESVHVGQQHRQSALTICATRAARRSLSP